MSDINEVTEIKSHALLSGVVESYCQECGDPCHYDLCDDCDDIRASLDADYWGQDDDYDEPDYSDFDCTCGAWQWSENSCRPIHIADCICGSSEPWT